MKRLATNQQPQGQASSGALLQRRCACGSHANGGECAACRGEREGALRRTAVQRAAPGARPDPIQAKLVVNQPGDVYEREADRVADEVMRMPEPSLQRQEEGERPRVSPLGAAITPLAQRQETAPEDDDEEEPLQAKASLQRQEGEPEEDDEEEPLQARSAGPRTPRVTPELEAQIQGLRGGGSPLPAATRAFFEPRFGHDFSGVRVHTGARASEAARAVNAHAFTVGRDVVFAAGQYAPGTGAGQRLLGHELTHVVQQEAEKQSGTVPQLLERQPRPAPMIQRQPAGARHANTNPNAQMSQPTANAGQLTQDGTFPALYWIVERKQRQTLVALREPATIRRLAQFLFGDPLAAEELAAINGISTDTALLPGQSIRVTGVKGRSFTPIALSHFNAAPKIPAWAADPQKHLAAMGVSSPEEFTTKKQHLDQELERDFALIVSKLDERHYSNSDEGRVISILRRWGEEKLTSKPETYRDGGDYLDQLFFKLLMKSKNVGIIADQVTSYYSLIFNHFDRVQEVIAIRDRYSIRYRRESGTREMSFGSFFWDQVKEGKVRDQIFAYFRGLLDAGEGFIKGIITLITDPAEVLKAIGNLPSTLKTLWQNKEKLWQQFLSASPEDQARMIGRLFGELEILIATAGAGGGGKAATTAPQMATAVAVVPGPGGAALAWQGARAASIDLAMLGREGARMTALTGQLGTTAEAGKKKVDKLADEAQAEASATKEQARRQKESEATRTEKSPSGQPSADKRSRSTAQEIEEVRKGEIEGRERSIERQPETDLPEGSSRSGTRRQAGVSPEEIHHIATRFRAQNRAILERVGLNIDNELNLIKNFSEHGQLRGWYNWQNGSYRYVMRGHHPDYHRWVTSHLERVAPQGLAPTTALRNIVRALHRLERIIKRHPEVLQYGPRILPPRLQNLTP